MSYGRNKLNINLKIKNVLGKATTPFTNKNCYMTGDHISVKVKDDSRGFRPNLNFINNDNDKDVGVTTLRKPIGIFPKVGLTNKMNLRKDVIKIYEKNMTKYKKENNNPDNSKNPNNVKPSSSFNFISGNKGNKNMISTGLLSTRPNKSTEIILTGHSPNQVAMSQIVGSNGNMNIVYSELAKQLKNNKSIIRHNKIPDLTENSEEDKIKDKDKENQIPRAVTAFKNNVNTYNQSSDNFYCRLENTPARLVERVKSTRIAGKGNIHSEGQTVRNITNNGGTKTTKDSTVNSNSVKIKSNSMSNFLKDGNDIETPEELHMFYVYIFQNNKKLAFKFEQSGQDDSKINSEL